MEEQVFPSPPPPAYQMPEPIPDTPENVARAIMQGPPKKEWRYLKDKKRKESS
jgi:hypothetical protein